MNNIQQNFILFRYVIAATIVTLTTGTVFYHYVEKWNWLDSYYFCIVTLATVGYGDFAPKTIPGKLFTTFYIIAGVGIITSFISILVQRWKSRVENRNLKNKDK